MYRLIYLSTSKSLTDDDLTQLLIKSQKSNRLNDISGILLHKNGEFIQVLEGKKKAVTDLFNVIKKDNRHENIVAFDKKDIEKRYFSGYFMAFNQKHFEKLNNYESLRDFNHDKILKSGKDAVVVFLKTFLEAHQKYELEN